MKRLSAFILALCLLLSACAESPGPDSVPSSSTPPHPIPSDPIPSNSVPPDPDPSESAPPDCSAHGDEYVTKLTDLKDLSLGKQVLAYAVGPADWSGRTWDGGKVETWGYDVRFCDVSEEDFSGIADWNSISFNSDTLWPPADKLPEGFDPEAVLELSKDPGLGIRALHDQGITGEGIGVAIIDHGLYTGHEQYKDNLMLYECVHARDGQLASMHGSAVSSIAVGRDVGVAPGAKLYYIDCSFGHYTDDGFEYDMSIVADSVYRVLEINRNLPQEEKIRVISISLSITPQKPGYQEFVDAVQAAGVENILVLTVENQIFYPGFEFIGMNREGLADPNDPHSYNPAAWLPPHPSHMDDTILVPMGGRTYAACSGEAKYEWNYEGGMSWAVPWLAGFYALCCQAAPDCTPERFFRAVQDTAAVKLLREDVGQTYCFGRIIDPAAAIQALKNQ